MRYIDRTAKWMVGGLAAAVALSGLGVVSAGTSGPAPTFTAITPCRLVDTRPGAINVGPRSSPLGEAEEVDVEVRGVNGQCNIPNSATAITANVIAVGPSAASFLSIWPADRSNPGTSSLNYVAGQAPTPNTISVALSASGAITLFNRFGTVDVVIDVSGYFADHTHDDRYYTKTEIDDAIAEVPALSAYTKAEVDAALSVKADSSSVYTRSQVDAKDAAKANSADVYTRSQVDAKDAAKANSADVYTRSQVDAKDAAKANSADVYTRSQVDAKDAVKANSADVYTRTLVDAKDAVKANSADVYTKSQVYTRAEVDALVSVPATYIAQSAAFTCSVAAGTCAAGAYNVVAECAATDDATGGSAVRTLGVSSAEEAHPSRPSGTPPGTAAGWQASDQVALADGTSVTAFAVCATVEAP